MKGHNQFLSKLVLCFSAIVFLVSCKTSSKAPQRVVKSNTGTTVFDQVTKSSDVNTLLRVMTGSFTSAAQAKDDTSYYEITLHMYPIWTTKEHKYLYIEQAETAQPEKPSRQQVYKLLADGNGGFESHIYTLSDPDRFVGKWQEPSFFDQFGEEIISEKEGCTVYLSQHADGSYSGSTRMDHCKTTMKGANYETSRVKLRESSVMSWHKGFDVAGQQVWGAEQGGYRFERVEQ